ncbi:MAG: hypothetical protein GX989_05620 [Firmicutes bacterium]|jgi:stage III sporulation protein AB|nr:hypothetical protein [Bacillota bacterium]
MLLKYFGAALIIASTYFYGNSISSFYRNRVGQLEELLLGLEMFHTEINYGLTPLPLAFMNIGAKLREPVGAIFLGAAREMQKSRGLSARRCWQNAWEDSSGALAFSAREMKLLERLGLAWGKGDKNDQLRQTALIQELLRQALREAREELQKNDKMWKYLGLLGGTTLVIFLL